MSAMKSKHAFGSEANVDNAIDQGLIDAYDILFLDEGKIGWIDKNGNKVVLEDRQQVALVSALPAEGKADVIYIYGGNIYLWDGVRFNSPIGEGGSVTESVVDDKIDTAKNDVLEAAKAYADQQIAESSHIVVEF